MALALAVAPLGAGAHAETLKPVDAQDPGFARLSLARAPGLVWQLDLERVEKSTNKTVLKEPQRKADLVGLMLPGDGRALALFTAVETDGRRVGYFRVADGEGRLAGPGRSCGERSWTSGPPRCRPASPRCAAAASCWRASIGARAGIGPPGSTTLKRGGLPVAGLISGSEHRAASAGQRHDHAHVSRSFLELYRYD